LYAKFYHKEKFKLLNHDTIPCLIHLALIDTVYSAVVIFSIWLEVFIGSSIFSNDYCILIYSLNWTLGLTDFFISGFIPFNIASYFFTGSRRTQHFNPWMICLSMWILSFMLLLPALFNASTNESGVFDKACDFTSPYTDLSISTRLELEREDLTCVACDQELICTYCGIYTACVLLVLLSNTAVWLKLAGLKNQEKENGSLELNLKEFAKLEKTLVIISFTGGIFYTLNAVLYWKNCINPCAKWSFLFSWGMENLYLWNFVVNFMIYFMRDKQFQSILQQLLNDLKGIRKSEDHNLKASSVLWSSSGCRLQHANISAHNSGSHI